MFLPFLVVVAKKFIRSSAKTLTLLLRVQHGSVRQAWQFGGMEIEHFRTNRPSIIISAARKKSFICFTTLLLVRDQQQRTTPRTEDDEVDDGGKKEKHKNDTKKMRNYYGKLLGSVVATLRTLVSTFVVFVRSEKYELISAANDIVYPSS